MAASMIEEMEVLRAEAVVIVEVELASIVGTAAVLSVVVALASTLVIAVATAATAVTESASRDDNSKTGSNNTCSISTHNSSRSNSASSGSKRGTASRRSSNNSCASGSSSRSGSTRGLHIIQRVDATLLGASCQTCSFLRSALAARETSSAVGEPLLRGTAFGVGLRGGRGGLRNAVRPSSSFYLVNDTN